MKGTQHIDMDDDQLIHEAAMLAGVIEIGEQLSLKDIAVSLLILREMRAETETVRLGKRLAAHYGIKDTVLELVNS